MSDLKLGQTIEGTANRDAIHIAVAPVVAVEKLWPGQHIGLDHPSDPEKVGTRAITIGIVDPFLKHPVMPDDRFWMFLYPNTIQSLRHEWTHPAFTVKEPAKANPSLTRLREIADEAGLSYEDLMEGAEAYLQSGEYLCDGSRWGGFDFPADFWDHWENVTGRKTTDRGSFFSCSC